MVNTCPVVLRLMSSEGRGRASHTAPHGQHTHSQDVAKAPMGAALCTFPVGPDKGQDHSLFLSALEAINRLNLKLRVLAGEVLSEQIHLKQKAEPIFHYQTRDCKRPASPALQEWSRGALQRLQQQQAAVTLCVVSPPPPPRLVAFS